MPAASTTGVGQGSAGKLTGRELAILANGPEIVAAGRFFPTNPLTNSNYVIFPKPITGSYENYVVILTGVGISPAFIEAYNNPDGDFYGFVVTTDTTGPCMYAVITSGHKPSTG